jgi:FkbM family methyltransferase
MTNETLSDSDLETSGLMALRNIAKSTCLPNFPIRGKKAKRLFRHKTAELLDECYLDLMRLTGVKQFFECGAHEAHSSIQFVRRFGGKAVAIEANPYVYQEKTQKAEKHGVTTLNLALAAHEGELQFHIPLDSRIAGSASLLTKADNQHVSIMVKTKTLDQIVETYGLLGTPCSLWIDVEGMAFEVLTGGEKTLATETCALIKVELEDVPQWLNQVTAEKVDVYLQAFGFIPVLCDLEYESQFNAIYVKQSFIPRLLPIIIQSWCRLGQIKLSASEYLFPKVVKMDTYLID